MFDLRGMKDVKDLQLMNGEQRRLKLDTLIRLRWLAVIGQATAILIVYYVLKFDVHFASTLLVVMLSACLNLTLSYRYPKNYRVEETSAMMLLGFDVFQLATLLYLTGGLQNPFSTLFLAPVLISATILPPKRTQTLGFLAISCASFLAFWHETLPWLKDESLVLPHIYVLGVWIALLLGLVFISVYAWRVSEEARQLSDALAATEFVLAREQHLTIVDGLAAAAAHQLGTPLATIALVVNEIDKNMESGNIYKDDIFLIKQEAVRCRDILSKIASLGDETTGPLDTLSLEHLVEEVSAPHRLFGITISTHCEGVGAAPSSTRNAGVLYGLGNLIENALDFAQSTIVVLADWNEAEVKVTIQDDGPGFARDVMSRLGDPYVTTRPLNISDTNERNHGGMGLGLFIAKTLLERSGAEVKMQNATPPDHGAIVTIIWSRRDFEAGLRAYGMSNGFTK